MADLGFPRGTAIPKEAGGANLLFGTIFSENGLKIKELGLGRACLAPPLPPPHAAPKIRHCYREIFVLTICDQVLQCSGVVYGTTCCARSPLNNNCEFHHRASVPAFVGKV